MEYLITKSCVIKIQELTNFFDNSESKSCSDKKNPETVRYWI